MVKRESRLLILVAVVSLFAGYGLYHVYNDPVETADTDHQETALSAIPFTDTQGEKSVLGDWTKPLIIVNFWAPWCAPCRREIPALINIQQEYRDSVRVIGLALDSVENVQDFAEEYKMNYPSYIAGANIPMYNAAFNNESGSLPHTAIVNQDRLLSYTHTGEITEAQLRTKIDQLLSKK